MGSKHVPFPVERQEMRVVQGMHLSCPGYSLLDFILINIGWYAL